MTLAPLRIGVAACFMHADPTRPVFKGKTLLYLEQSAAHWLMAGGALPLLLPTPAGDLKPRDLLAGFDGLLLQGGADVAPLSYGEEPLKPEWAGDRPRDVYETALIDAARTVGLPLLGLCRGLQMLNVALGGTLYQDIATQQPGALWHRDWERYDALQHDIAIESGSWLAASYGGRRKARVNTVHHQAIARLADGLVAEARAIPDGIIEAVRYGGPGADDWFAYAVQWHPEFQDPADQVLLPTAPLRDLFLRAALAHRDRMQGSTVPG